MRSSATPAPRLLRGRSSGQALTEFALLSPVFFMLIFGIVAASLMVNAQATLDNATREAAREAAVCGGSASAYTDSAASNTAGGNGSPCAHAARAAVYRNLGILAVTSNNPTIVVSGPAHQSGADCAATDTAGTPYYGGGGCEVQVTTTYKFSFLIGLVVGDANAPGVTLTSVARSGGQ